MAWFSVSTYLKAHSSNLAGKPLFEECVFLIDAVNEEEAKMKASALARAQEATYFASTGSEISWLFHSIRDVYSVIGLPSEGCEIFGRFLGEEAILALEKDLLAP